jgi:cyclase
MAISPPNTSDLSARRHSKAIRFLVNTSYHGDHAYGNYVFPDSTVVIQHPATKRYMDEKFEDDRRFMLGLMGKGKGIERVQSRSADITVSDTIRVDLGGRAVEIRHFGFAQTPGDLVIWTPDAKVLWVGNMIQAPAPALPWLLEGRHRETIETLTKVRDFLPEGRDHHSRDTGARCGRRISIFRFSICVSLIPRLVQQSQRVDLSRQRSNWSVCRNYSEYSLFDWAH